MLLLLDLDGTLIHDRGYRAAIDATVTRYCEQYHLPTYTPSDDDVHVLHAHGYSNEWDSVAFLAGIIHHAAATGITGRPDFQSWTRKTADLPGLPNERARELLLRESPPQLSEKIHALLDHVTDVQNTVTTRIFAEMILGSALFQQHYGLAPAFDTHSLLEMLDEPLIDDRSHDIILSHRSCIFTARPSLPPGYRQQNNVPKNGYLPVHPPEAEIGLKLLHLDQLPMVALGHVQWLADLHGERVYDLTKPGPVQALAAMLVARGVEEHPALAAAYQLWKHGRHAETFGILNGEDVFVFEDNAGGVRACHTATALLRTFDVAVTIHGMGIATAEAKRKALVPVCDQLFANVNDALKIIHDR
ncbi:MAG: hypothetical protein M1546_08215 [Chloroflexi bacterium]|nr:hypothetical protein [Chloroflexota bacterium]